MNPYDNVLHPNPRGRGSISTRGLQWQTRWTPKRPKLQCGWGILSPKTSRDIEFTYRSSVYIYIQYIIIYNEYDIYIYIYTHVCMYIYIYLHIQYTAILVCIGRHSIMYPLWGCLKTRDPQLQINLFKVAYMAPDHLTTSLLFPAVSLFHDHPKWHFAIAHHQICLFSHTVILYNIYIYILAYLEFGYVLDFS